VAWDHLPLHASFTVRGSEPQPWTGGCLDSQVSIGNGQRQGPSSAFVFRPEPDAAPGRVENELRIDGGLGFRRCRTLATRIRTPTSGGRKRSRPPPGEARAPCLSLTPAATSFRRGSPGTLPGGVGTWGIQAVLRSDGAGAGSGLPSALIRGLRRIRALTSCSAYPQIPWDRASQERPWPGSQCPDGSR
jgi:hypothetical protein